MKKSHSKHRKAAVNANTHAPQKSHSPKAKRTPEKSLTKKTAKPNAVQTQRISAPKQQQPHTLGAKVTPMSNSNSTSPQRKSKQSSRERDTMEQPFSSKFDEPIPRVPEEVRDDKKNQVFSPLPQRQLAFDSHLGRSPVDWTKNLALSPLVKHTPSEMFPIHSPRVATSQ